MATVSGAYLGHTPMRGARKRARVIAACSGIALAIAGLALMLWPLVAGSIVIPVIVGASLLCTGVFSLVRFGRHGGGALGSIFLCLIGLFAVIFPGPTATAMLAFAGLFLLLFGALCVCFGAVANGRWRVAALVPGVLLIAGGVIAIVVPNVALVIAGVFGGLCLLSIGSLLVSAALRMRGTEAPAQGAGPGGETIVVETSPSR